MQDGGIITAASRKKGHTGVVIAAAPQASIVATSLCQVPICSVAIQSERTPVVRLPSCSAFEPMLDQYRVIHRSLVGPTR